MNNRSFHVTAIILAAGTGSRMKADISKQRMIICGESVLRHTLHAFSDSEYIDDIVLVCRPEEECTIKLELANDFPKVKAMVCGGKTRAESALRGFLSISEECQFVAIHDAARPLFDIGMAEKVFAEALEKGNAVCASKVRDTVKRTDNCAYVTDSVDRDNLWLIQTPQVFEKRIYGRALDNAKKEGCLATDDSSLVSLAGEKVNLCETPSYNIKITYPEDVLTAQAIINYRGDKNK